MDSLKQVFTQVLVVDDDPLVRAYLSLILTTAGYEVSTAETGEAALESMRHTFRPILIMDIDMPGLSGLEVCRAIRRHTYASYVYIILHSSKETEIDILAGLDAGADAHVSKRTPKSLLIGRLQSAQRILHLENSLKMSCTDRELEIVTVMLATTYNRRYLLRQLENELNVARRAQDMLSVLVINFDHFEKVNSRFGHAIGDYALREVTRRIGMTLRRNCDWYARLGGDGFAIVLPQTDLSGANAVAKEFLCAVLEQPMKVADRVLCLSVNIGISVLDTTDYATMTAEMLLDRADQNLSNAMELTLMNPVRP